MGYFLALESIRLSKLETKNIYCYYYDKISATVDLFSKELSWNLELNHTLTALSLLTPIIVSFT
jgi:hypothetical protein